MTFLSNFKEFRERAVAGGIRVLNTPLAQSVTTVAVMLVLVCGLWVKADGAVAAPLSTSPLSPATVETLDVASSNLSTSLDGLESSGLISYLPPGNAITDGKALLRYALPIKNKPIRAVQKEIEGISNLLRVQGARPFSSVKRSLKRSEKILKKPEKILEAVPSERQGAATALLGDLNESIADLMGYAEEADREAIYPKRSEALETIGEIESLMVSGFPFEIPEEYDHLPRLLGRATVAMDTDYGTTTIVLDGYSAPLTAGNFLDLVQRGFYDGVEFNRVEDFYVVQAGDPPGPATGFIDPETQEERTIPLEVLVQGDKEPLYEFTMEQMGITLDDPVLPFAAFGTLGMARPDRDANGGSSQFFFLKFQTEMTPAGINLLDGEYAVFGYAIENKEIIDKFKVGDRINSIRILNGAENLFPHA